MAEDEDMRRAVEELHEPDRMADLLLARLRRDGAPPELIECAEKVRQGLAEWQGR
jgi:hypothetical protein